MSLKSEGCDIEYPEFNFLTKEDQIEHKLQKI